MTDPAIIKKIKFPNGSSSPFFSALDQEVKQLLSSSGVWKKAYRLLWIKLAFYLSLHLSAYILLFTLPHPGFGSLLSNYIFIGISGMLLAFNVSHDACHGTFSKKKYINHWLYHLTFNMQGTNAYLWKIRHTASHHLFPNVDGCDADIDNNPMIRLSPHHPIHSYQRFQHFYSFFLYCIYTLHWILFKDILYLTKKNLANLKNIHHPVSEYLRFICWKLAYISLLIVAPIAHGYPVKYILAAFVLMHVGNSLFFIHSLIATHLCMETQFPKAGRDGVFSHDYYTHQLATSLDYSPTNKLYNWVFGGFNSHAAHHLYPKLPHTLYPLITPLIQQKARVYHIQYNLLPLHKAIQSHYSYLKMMGRTSKLTITVQ